MLSAAATVVLPIPSVVVGFGVFLVGGALAKRDEVIAPLRRRQAQAPSQQTDQALEQQLGNPEEQPEEQLEEELEQPEEAIAESDDPHFRHYRLLERQRVVASLKANSSILVVGREGSGKSVLCAAVMKDLTEEGYMVLDAELATPKNMVKAIADELGVPTVEKPMEQKSKVLLLDDLKKRLEEHFKDLKDDKKETVFLIVDDVHRCDIKFRDWLKVLKRQGVPMCLFATDPPRTDIFLNLPRIELAPLPDYCIREIMEQAAMERGLSLPPNVLANLQQRAGGNPMLAQKAVNEEYLGIDNEAGDHSSYFDISPLLVLIGITFMASKFLARGLNDPSLYIISSIASAVFMGLSRLLFGLPKESKRIE